MNREELIKEAIKSSTNWIENEEDFRTHEELMVEFAERILSKDRQEQREKISAVVGALQNDDIDAAMKWLNEFLTSLKEEQ